MNEFAEQFFKSLEHDNELVDRFALIGSILGVHFAASDWIKLGIEAQVTTGKLADIALEV